jgi:Pyruvate/2-oxoacid:ferredoxin oxidoreductase delta subunit
MPKKKVVLNFAPHIIGQPITYRLTGDYGLVVNILRARITPNEWGRMVLELSGNGEQLEEGLNFLERMGVGVESLAHGVKWLEERCIHCTACVAPCRTHALAVDRTDMTMSFDQEHCIACDLCLSACPYQALEMSFE